MKYLLMVCITVVLFGLGSPAIAQLSGSYDIGGGNMDYTSILSAVADMYMWGLSGPVICNIYNTTMWTGQVNISGDMPGLSAMNTLTFQNAPGESPVIQAPYYGEDGFAIYGGADYVTIQGLEITNCVYAGINISGATVDSCSHIRVLNNYIHDNGLYLDSGSGVTLWYAADCEIRGNYISGCTIGIQNALSRRNLFANNMIYDLSGLMVDSYGLYSYDGDNSSYYYNTIYNAEVCFYTTYASFLNIKNNIFYPSGGGNSYCIYFDENTSGVTSDYNDLYAVGANVGYVYGFGPLVSLSNWQGATGLDLNSISANPNFVNPGTGNLHIINPSPVGMAGIALAEVTDDYDGDTRKAPNSDIGADEYLLPLAGSYDIGGGNNDYATIISAVQAAATTGIVDAVTFNVYTGTYDGQVNLSHISGTDSIKTLTIQPASGQFPVVTNTTGSSQFDGNGFYFTGADYVTIQNMEISNCYADGIRNYFSGSDSSTHNCFIGNYIHNVGLFGDYSGISLYNGADCQLSGNEIEGDYYGINCSYGNGNLITNNMIYYNSNSGIYDYQGTNNHYYYNSVYLESSPGITYGFYTYHGTNVETKNNIFYHSGVGTHYAYSIIGNLGSYPILSDYNDLYAPGAHVGYYNGNRTTLANWQTATGLDANSISADPNFVTLDTPDLHIDAPSPVDSAGTPIAEVTEDFDGDERNADRPDIGADEFMAPLSGVYDVGGGANHFPNTVAAAEAVMWAGMAGPVTFNIFSGFDFGEVYLNNTISGLSAANPLIFQNAPGESPVIWAFSSHGIRINGADYITIRGLEIRGAQYNGIYVYVSPVGSDTVTNVRIIDNYIHDVGSGIGSPDAIGIKDAIDCEVSGNEIDGGYGGVSLENCSGCLIANNMIYECIDEGLYDYAGVDNLFYYNSVYMDGGTAFGSRFLDGTIINNNILYQDGPDSNSFVIVYANQEADSITSDYNNLFAPNGTVCFYNHAWLHTLVDYQTTTGLDLNSISNDPNYISITSPFNLHITLPSPSANAGTPLVEVTDDFDGESRDPIAPDIGADEFSYAYWVNLTPDSSTLLAASGTTINHMFMVENLGEQNDVYNLTVSVTGESWAHEIYNGSGGMVIDSLAVNVSTIDSFIVHVTIPGAATFGQSSFGEVTVYSRHGTDNILSDTSYTTTYTAMSGIYHVGGGNNDFSDVVSAANALSTYGIAAACEFHIYSGTYNGQVDLPAINGTGSTNTILFQPASGQSPVITNTTGTTYDNGNGFYLTGADYVTIQNLEIANCYSNGIYNYKSGQDSSTHNSFIGNYVHDVDAIGNASGINLLYGIDCDVIGNEIDGPNYGITSYFSKDYLIANNMLYDIQYCGMYIDHSSGGAEFYYNSVMSAPNYAVRYSSNTANPDVIFKNNIIYQTGSAWGFGISGSQLPGGSDYNNIYAPSGNVGYYGGPLNTLAQWQAATGLDANSISADPNFVSASAPFDLHINFTSPVVDAGTAIAAIADDFDGDPRNFTIPDIGADEFYNPMSGVYDIGGGANHFPTPIAAVDSLQMVGMSGPVIFNIFTGTYTGQVTVDNTVPGLGETNPLTFQNAPGESPVITSPSQSSRGFWILSADYVTIQGMEITNCYYAGIGFIGTGADSAKHNRAIGNLIHNCPNDGGIILSRAVNCEAIGNEISNSKGGIACSNNGRNNLFANNMIYDINLYGFYSYYSLDDRYYYNSVYMDTTNVFYFRGSTNAIVQNNIFFQDGTGNAYAFYLHSATNLVSDYNDLYAPNAYVGYYSAPQTTLYDWQTATGLDLNSISEDPFFVSTSAPFDLHIDIPSPVDSAGTPIAEVTDDFDGDTRHPTTPDIGADEVGIVGPPEPVEDLVITRTSSTDITLSWSPALNALQYHIYKSTTNPSSGFTLLGSTGDTTYVDINAIVDESISFYYVTSDSEPMETDVIPDISRLRFNLPTVDVR